MKKIIEECIKINIPYLNYVNNLLLKDINLLSHSKKVTYYSLCILNSISIEDNLQQYLKLFCSSMLHDLGKINIDDYILQKPSSLTEKEYEIVKTHPCESLKIMNEFCLEKDISDAILHHHERYDGKGYPSGLSKENIPILSRIIAVADAFDAMTSSRCYRKRPMLKEYALGELLENAGTQFDPYITGSFIKLIESGKIHLGWEFSL